MTSMDQPESYDWFAEPDYLPFTSIVCDNGSYSLKVGFGGHPQPREIIPTVVGKPRKEMSIVGYGQRYMYAGQAAKENRGVLDTSRPIHDGVITDWDAMEQMWKHMYFDRLKVPPEKFDILHTEPAGNPRENREKLTEIMFELFNVPRMLLVPATTVAMYGTGGSATGVLVDSGHDGTRVVPTCEGYPLRDWMVTVPVGGRHVTEHMTRLLVDRGSELTMAKHSDAVGAIKEKHCYVALQDPEVESARSMARNRERQLVYRLPDEMLIEDKGETFRAPEIMFDPGLCGIESKCGGVAEAVYKTVISSPIKLYEDLLNNIVLVGGNTLFPNMKERLLKDLRGLAHSTTKMRVVAHPERKFAAWVGGSVLANSSTFRQTCIDSAEYAERGSAAVHYKCFM